MQSILELVETLTLISVSVVDRNAWEQYVSVKYSQEEVHPENLRDAKRKWDLAVIALREESKIPPAFLIVNEARRLKGLSDLEFTYSLARFKDYCWTYHGAGYIY